MHCKLLTAITAFGLFYNMAHPSLAGDWHSPTGDISISNLDGMCRGRYSFSLKASFKQKNYMGNAIFDQTKIEGCEPGDIIVGNFHLYNINHYCKGQISVNWREPDYAYVEWNIANSKLNVCPVASQRGGTTTFSMNESTTKVPASTTLSPLPTRAFSSPSLPAIPFAAPEKLSN